MRVWVTGAGGLIGSCLVAATEHAPADCEVIGLTRSRLDLGDFAAVRDAFRREPPGAVIHCAALSKTPDCQTNPSRARFLNVEVTRCLAELAESMPFVFFSTDLVFDGRKGHYSETDCVNPLSVYAETKVEAETEVLRNPAHTVVRTSLNLGTSPTGDRAFNEQIHLSCQQGRSMRLFSDEYRSPIPAKVTAQAVWELLKTGATGVFHLGGGERLSRWEIGQLYLRRHPECSGLLSCGSLREYTGAPRPPDTSLNCSRIQRELSFRLPGLSGWLADHPGECF